MNIHKNNGKHITIMSVIALMATAGSAPAHSQATLVTKTIGLSGEVAPGTDDIAFMHLTRPIISDSGAVVFMAMLDRTVTDQHNDGGIWIWDGADLRLVVREGDASGNFARLEPPQFIANGDLVFTARCEEGIEAIWKKEGGVLTRIVGVGDNVPPDDYCFLEGVLLPALCGPDFISFRAFVPYAYDFLPIWTTRSGEIDLVLPVGTILLGMDQIARGGVGDLAISATGEHVFSYGADDYYYGHGIWRESNGEVSKVVFSADYPFDHPLYKNLGYGSLTVGQQRVGFTAGWLENPDDPTPIWIRLYYLADDEGVELFVQQGGEAPNLPGAKIAFPSRLDILPNDEVVLIAALTGEGINESNNVAVWRGEPDDLSLIVREGEHIPGLPGDVVIRDFQTVAINEHYAAAYVTLFGYTVGDNDRALFLIDNNGEKHLITRVADKFDVTGDGSDLRSVKHIGLLPSNRQLGRSSLNADGTLAFMLEFYDGSSGVFTARLRQPCAGDITGDGITHHGDLAALLAAWNTVPGDPNWNPAADLDGDGHIGHGDLAGLLADWGCGM